MEWDGGHGGAVVQAVACGRGYVGGHEAACGVQPCVYVCVGGEGWGVGVVAAAGVLNE